MTKPQDYWVRHEHGGDRMTFDEARALSRLPVYAILDNIRSAHNVGSAFRSADGAGIGELLICGYAPTPPHRHLAKTAMGGEAVVPWQHCETTLDAIEVVRERGCQVLAMEFNEQSVPLWEVDLQFPLALVFGNEAEGLSEEVMARCDAIVHLPMRGLKNSLNVSVAFGITAYEVLRRYEQWKVMSGK